MKLIFFHLQKDNKLQLIKDFKNNYKTMKMNKNFRILMIYSDFNSKILKIYIFINYYTLSIKINNCFKFCLKRINI